MEPRANQAVAISANVLDLESLTKSRGDRAGEIRRG